MQVDLDSTYRIEYDGLCFQLQKKRIVTGEHEAREADIARNAEATQ